jgi:hypothetical protein
MAILQNRVWRYDRWRSHERHLHLRIIRSQSIELPDCIARAHKPSC